MNILFIREFPLVDGTFTLLIRLAEKMNEDGHKPHFLFLRNNIDQGLQKKIHSIAPIFYYHQLPELKSAGFLPQIDAIHGIIGGELLFRSYDTIKSLFFPRAAIVLGIYHPRAFITKTLLWPSFDMIIYKKYFSKVPSQNLLFMNNTVKVEHESFFNLKFPASPIIPLLVEIPSVLPRRESINKNKIVSIGRLVSFKNYITPLIHIVTALNSKGYSFEYHIYGEGPLYKSIKTLIGKMDAGKFVFLHGHLDYKQFNVVIKDALLFVGMGTSVIESSAQGIPSLLAVESFHHDGTYGWFFNQEGYEVGEQIPLKKDSSYEPFILEAYNANAEQYRLLCENSWYNSRRFSIDVVMPQYYNFLRNADRDFSFIVPGWKKILLKLARQPLKLRLFIKKGYHDK